MITKNDLKQIRGIVREEIDPVNKRLDNIDTKLENTESAVKGLGKKLSNVEKAVKVVDKKLDQAQEDIAEILTEVINYHTKLEKRVVHIEESLDISTSH